MGVSACFAHVLHARAIHIHDYFHACMTHVNKGMKESKKAKKTCFGAYHRSRRLSNIGRDGNSAALIRF